MRSHLLRSQFSFFVIHLVLLPKGSLHHPSLASERSLKAEESVSQAMADTTHRTHLLQLSATFQQIGEGSNARQSESGCVCVMFGVNTVVPVELLLLVIS